MPRRIACPIQCWHRGVKKPVRRMSWSSVDSGQLIRQQWRLCVSKCACCIPNSTYAALETYTTHSRASSSTRESSSTGGLHEMMTRATPRSSTLLIILAITATLVSGMYHYIYAILSTCTGICSFWGKILT